MIEIASEDAGQSFDEVSGPGVATARHAGQEDPGAGAKLQIGRVELGTFGVVRVSPLTLHWSIRVQPELEKGGGSLLLIFLPGPNVFKLSSKSPIKQGTVQF